MSTSHMRDQKLDVPALFLIFGENKTRADRVQLYRFS